MPPRLHWYYCPHRERFLARGIQDCRFCDPSSQEQLPRSVPVEGSGVLPSVRAVFPLLNEDGEPMPLHSSPVPADEGVEKSTEG